MTNRLQRSLAPIDRLPAFVRTRARSFALGNVVPFVGTARIQAEELTASKAVFTLANKRRVQNHISGVHAAATALLGETCSGLVVGMNVPDDRLPLLKSMHIDYPKRSSGALRAVATLSDEQRAKFAAEPKGDVEVVVEIRDEADFEPVRATFVWAWIPKKR